MDGRRILIVEGNAELRTVLSDALREQGHEVVTAGDRTEAVEREDLEDFDLIISDLAEYADSGVQIVSELKRKRLFVPIVVSSEEAQQAGIVKAFKLGATNYLRKPYDHEELSHDRREDARLQAALRRRPQSPALRPRAHRVRAAERHLPDERRAPLPHRARRRARRDKARRVEPLHRFGRSLRQRRQARQQATTTRSSYASPRTSRRRRRASPSRTRARAST
jgi:DNA-binding response OmpR family regulator